MYAGPIAPDRVAPARRQWTRFAWLDAATAIIGAFALLVLVGDQIHTVSGDLALHYSFAKDIAETWTWPMGDKPWTSGMGPYPPFAHYLAAMLGLVTGSTFSALHDIAVLSVFACYLIVFRALATRGRVAGAIGIVIAASALLVLANNHASFGYEVFFNFFYAQAFGEALLLAYVYTLTVRAPGYAALGISAIVVFLLGWVYPQTALLAALAYLGFEGLTSLRAALRTRHLDGRSLVRLVAAGVVLPLAVVANPSFRYMIHVSANDGALNLGDFNRAVPLSAALLIGLGLAMAVLVRSEAAWARAAAFFASAGIAAGTATLLQWIVLVVAHSGSGYAVRKYAYLNFSLLACTVALLVAWRLGSSRAAKGRVFLAVAPPAAAVAMICVLPMSDSQPMHTFLSAEADETWMVRTGAEQAAIGNTASRNGSLPWYLNHAITMVDLKMEYHRAIAVVESMFDSTKQWPEWYTVVDDRRNVAPADCMLSSLQTSALKLVGTACTDREAPNLMVGQHVDLAQWGSKPPYLRAGWSNFESSGAWTDKSHAQIAFNLANGKASGLSLVLNGTAFLLPGHLFQKMIATVQPADTVTELTIDASNQGNPISIPLPNETRGDVTVDLFFEGAASPRELGLSGDDRHLGLFLRSFEVIPAKP